MLFQSTPSKRQRQRNMLKRVISNKLNFFVLAFGEIFHSQIFCSSKTKQVETSLAFFIPLNVGCFMRFLLLAGWVVRIGTESLFWDPCSQGVREANNLNLSLEKMALQAIKINDSFDMHIPITGCIPILNHKFNFARF